MSTSNSEILGEGEAASYIAALRWPNGPVCPYCHEAENIVQEENYERTGRYACHRCSRSFSVATGTIIARSALPLSKWLNAFQILGEDSSRSLDAIIRGIFHPVDTDPDIKLSVDGRAIRPEILDPLTYRFVVDEVPAEMQILSRHFVPAKQDPSSTDQRRLGIGIKSITIHAGDVTFEWAHDDPALVGGYYSPEPGQRWTTGRAVVPVQSLSHITGQFTLTLRLSHRNGLYVIDL